MSESPCGPAAAGDTGDTRLQDHTGTNMAQVPPADDAASCLSSPARPPSLASLPTPASPTTPAGPPTPVSPTATPARPLTPSSPAPHAPADKWSCEACTYQNFPLSRKCTMCQSAKPSLCEDIFRLQEAAAALPTDVTHAPREATLTAPHQANNDQDVIDEVTARVRPLRMSSPAATRPTAAASPPPGAGASGLDKWPCATCTYENWPKSTRCAMCGGSAPVPAPAPALASNVHQAKAYEPIGVNEVGREDERREDWLWLEACLGVVDGSPRPVHAYLSRGGDPARALTAREAALLDRASAFDAGHTLVHLAIRFQRQEILSALLSRISGGGPGLKRSPSYVAPDLASSIRRHIAGCIRVKKGGPFAGRYLNECATFSLPHEIEELPAAIQEQLFTELLDGDAQRTLERDGRVNWSGRGSRLLALWNRSVGDCLPDAVCQAAYGVFDRHNVLRQALHDTLVAGERGFFARFAAWEQEQERSLYTSSGAQLSAEWSRLVVSSRRPHAALHQIHVLALAHVARRPIIVYGVDVVTSHRGDPLGYARYQGIYLPLLWEPEFCFKAPLALGYTRGHFSALVPVLEHPQYICSSGESGRLLPLVDACGAPLPLPFLLPSERQQAAALARRYLCALAAGGVVSARTPPAQHSLLVAQMLDEWLNHYRRLAQQARGPFPPRLAADYCSDNDTDDE